MNEQSNSSSMNKEANSSTTNEQVSRSSTNEQVSNVSMNENVNNTFDVLRSFSSDVNANEIWDCHVNDIKLRL